MSHFLKSIAFAGGILLASTSLSHAETSAKTIDGSKQIERYAELVFHSYDAAYKDGLALQSAIEDFLGAPSEKNLEAAKHAWLESRNTYGQTEAFRFYEGPIDFYDNKTREEGPEGRLNAWPVNEAYIDYVKGNKKAGIVNNPEIPITFQTLKSSNQATDEADVSTGYHAIEFLLWGQDFSKDTAGTRSYKDYLTGEGNNDRRREYLKEVTNLLVEDLKFLVDSWQPGQDNYAKTFLALDEKDALSKIFTSLATLSGFELASERMATALDSGDQEDEHSCFSDNTHNDFIYNAKGIKNVYLGTYNTFNGASLHELVQEAAPDLDAQILAQLNTTEHLMTRIPSPIDSRVLATDKGSEGRDIMEKAVTSLQKQADLFKEAGKALGINVEVQAD